MRHGCPRLLLLVPGSPPRRGNYPRPRPRPDSARPATPATPSSSSSSSTTSSSYFAVTNPAPDVARLGSRLSCNHRDVRSSSRVSSPPHDGISARTPARGDHSAALLLAVVALLQLILIIGLKRTPRLHRLLYRDFDPTDRCRALRRFDPGECPGRRSGAELESHADCEKSTLTVSEESWLRGPDQQSFRYLNPLIDRLRPMSASSGQCATPKYTCQLDIQLSDDVDSNLR